MKKVLFLLFTCLLLMALVIPACKPAEEAGGYNIPEGGKTIRIGVIGPMQFIQGKQHWLGAVMAAEEINKAGGIKVGEETYYYTLIRSDSNETLSITDAAAAMEKIITVDKAQFVVGGFRTEGVHPMQDVAMDHKTIFLGCGAATASLNAVVKQDYNRYKYWFRVTPFVSAKLADNVIMTLAMASTIVKEETGLQRPLNAAVCAEGAQWADAITGIMKSWIPKKLGMEVSGVWRPSPNATDLNAEMTAMQAAKTDFIVPIISGAVGIPYGRSYGELKIPAASVGINVESQSLGYWAATNGFGNWDTGLASYSKNMEPTPLTKPFFEGFVARFEGGDVPSYTAGTYDALYILKSALERAGTLDADAVVVALEKTSQTTTVSPLLTFTDMDDPMGTPHDLKWGPGGSTGISCQWQDGELLGIWPNPAYGDAYVAAGYDPSWKTVNPKGVAKWKMPPLLLEKVKAEMGGTLKPTAPSTPSAPAAPSTPATPAAPAAPAAPAGPTSFEANTYTNDQYGFSIQYPKDWVARPELVTVPGTHLSAFGVEGYVPGVVTYSFAADAPESKEWVVKSFKSTGNTMPKVTSDIKEETLAGDVKAYTYTASYISATGYEVSSYVIDADRGDKRIRVNVFTIETFEPYNEALASEIAHTLTFK